MGRGSLIDAPTAIVQAIARPDADATICPVARADAGDVVRPAPAATMKPAARDEDDADATPAPAAIAWPMPRAIAL